MSDLNIIHRWSPSFRIQSTRPERTVCGIDAFRNLSIHIAADLADPPLPRRTEKYPHPRWCRRCVAEGRQVR